MLKDILKMTKRWLKGGLYATLKSHLSLLKGVFSSRRLWTLLCVVYVLPPQLPLLDYCDVEDTMRINHFYIIAHQDAALKENVTLPGRNGRTDVTPGNVKSAG